MSSKSLNQVQLIGNLGSDPETKPLKDDNKITTFPVATSNNRKDGTSKTEWHRIVCFNALAETCQTYLKKGDKVYIKGRIQSREYEDKEGNKRRSFDIIAEDMIMLGGGKKTTHDDDDFDM